SYGRTNNDSFRRRAVFWLAVEQSGCKRVPTTAGLDCYPRKSPTSECPEVPRHKQIGPQIENLPALQSGPLGGTRVKDCPLNMAIITQIAERLELAEMHPATDTSGCPIKCIHDLIRKRAYQLFEARGRQQGHELDDWLQAEREIKHHLGFPDGDK